MPTVLFSSQFSGGQTGRSWSAPECVSIGGLDNVTTASQKGLHVTARDKIRETAAKQRTLLSGL
jgi:hypothetical protein